MNKFQIGIPEIFDAGAKGEVLDQSGRVRSNAHFVQKPGGTPKQAWSEAMVAYLLVKYGVISRDEIARWSQRISEPYAVIEETHSAETVTVQEGETRKIRVKVFLRKGVLPENITVNLIRNPSPLKRWGESWGGQVLQNLGTPVEQTVDGAFIYELELKGLQGLFEYKVRAATNVLDPEQKWRWEWKYADGANSRVEFKPSEGEKKKVDPRSELRLVQTAVDEVLGELAAQRPITPRSANSVSVAAQFEEFAAEVLITSQNSQMIAVYAGATVSEKGSSEIKEFYERHPNYVTDLDVFWMDKIEEMRHFADNDLKGNPDAKLNFAFAMPLPESPQIRGWLLRYLKMIAQIKEKNPSQVKAAIKILAPRTQIFNSDLKEFWREAGRTGVAKALEVNETGTAFEVGKYLDQFGNALVYGAENLQIDPTLKKRLVKVSENVNPQTVFTVAAILAFELSGVKGQVGEEILRPLSENFQGLSYSSNGLEIHHEAMELIYQRYQAGQLFAVAA